ncbi:MAG: CHAP domain-containing protein [Bdellovibrionota bacterium]
MTPIELNQSIRAALLVEEAERWIGVQEVGANNRGQLVELFLNSIGLAPGLPWCMAFVQFCVAQVDRLASSIDPSAVANRMFRSAGCAMVWNMTSTELRSSTPEMGSVVIWKHATSSEGHCGIVIGVNGDGSFDTVEGNTSPSPGVNRDGDGVFRKSHSQTPTGAMELVGFICPWGVEE